MRVIYVDWIFVINFIVNYLILLITAKICSIYRKRRYIALGAFFGAAYAVFAAVFEYSFLNSPGIKLIFGALMAVMVFVKEKRILRVILVFFAVSAFFGGAVFAVGLLRGDGGFEPLKMSIMLPAFGISYGILSVVFKRLMRLPENGGVRSITVHLGDRSVSFNALSDTGNSLSDPITGAPVIVADESIICELFEDEVKRVLKTEKSPVLQFELLMKMKTNVKFKLIPYSTVGVKSGMLLGFRADRVLVDKNERGGMIVTVSPERISDGGVYSAIIST